MEEIVIMVVDDETEMRKMIRTFLERDGYKVIEATDGAHALSLFTEQDVHLFIVDIMMPVMDGFTLAEELKIISDVPIIFLSARGSEMDKVHGLKIGGDDYIIKPFSPNELLARIESLLRRAYNKNVDAETVKVGPLTINTGSFTVTLHDKPISLTKKEFGILHLLVKNRGRVFSREQLLRLVWEDDHHLSSERTVDTHMKTLRIKLGDFGKTLKTVWGVGYKFEV